MFSNPRGVAVIGASRTPGKLGHDVLHNVIRYGYQGAVYPINPASDEILGLKSYASVLQTPGPVDLAVVVIPSRYVAHSLTECGAKGVKGAVVISAGFREVGSEGRQREREIVDIARRYGMRLLGPNSLGLIDTTCQLNASFAAGMPRPGTIAFLSQSGALCTAILDMALADNMGFSRFVSLGNKADVDEVDLIQAWQDDPHTRVVMAYVEGIEAGPEFMQIARQVSCDKPILVIKSGTTSAGSIATRPSSTRTYSRSGSSLRPSSRTWRPYRSSTRRTIRRGVWWQRTRRAPSFGGFPGPQDSGSGDFSSPVSGHLPVARASKRRTPSGGPITSAKDAMPSVKVNQATPTPPSS
ncbi:MAG: CoA-binding protein, partial [Anaerolineae bacterium]